MKHTILNILKTNDKHLSEEEKIVLFTDIFKRIEEKKQKKRNSKRVIYAFLKYAAVAFLFFALGAILFYTENTINPQFYSQNMEEPRSDDIAKLIRPDGENILLENKKSVIEYTNDGKVKVNQKLFEPVQQKEKKSQVLNQLVIPYGKTSEIILSDGTKVYLNAGSRLVYPEFFTDKNREVFLVGEAFFEVEPDNLHPFIVQTTDIKVKVMGTKFNISAYPSDNIIQTVLIEGKVGLEQNNSRFFSESTELKPNQLATFVKSTKEIELEVVETENYILWKDGICKFESTDLNRITKKLERYYNIKFHYSNTMLGMIKISGKLGLNEKREEIMSRLATAASVKITKTGTNYYVISN